jgi:hypothetical protein
MLKWRVGGVAILVAATLLIAFKLGGIFGLGWFHGPTYLLFLAVGLMMLLLQDPPLSLWGILAATRIKGLASYAQHRYEALRQARLTHPAPPRWPLIEQLRKNKMVVVIALALVGVQYPLYEQVFELHRLVIANARIQLLQVVEEVKLQAPSPADRMLLSRCTAIAGAASDGVTGRLSGFIADHWPKLATSP